MKRVLLAVTTLLTIAVGFAQLQDVLPTVQRFLDERSNQERITRIGHNDAPSSRFAPSRVINGVEMVDAFIDIESTDVIGTLRAHGILVNCEFGDFVTAQIPVGILTEVHHIPGVKDVEISRLVELCTDTTLSVTHAGQVINGTDYKLPQGYDGSGVVIGIIDTGFDYQHLAFRCADDTSRTRIVRVYDPENSTGHPAIVDGNTLPGSIFMGDQIYSLTTDNLENSHGTHTASIAAGTHVNGYGGMAPGAEIVLCSSRMLNLNIPETEIINCIKYIYSYADSVGKPCVISVSVSTNEGPHDGNDRISKAVAMCTGPGHIFVIASGNNANDYYYASGPATLDRQFNTLLGKRPDNDSDLSSYYKNVWFQVWVRQKNAKPLIKIHIYDKQTSHIVWQSELINLSKLINVSEISDYFSPDLTYDSNGYVSVVISSNSSQKYMSECKLYNLRCNDYMIDEAGRTISRYAIGMTVYPPHLVYPNKPDSIYVDSWVGMGSRLWYPNTVFRQDVDENGDSIMRAFDRFYAKPDPRSCIGTYAVHDSVISAGAYVGRNAYYSLTRGMNVQDNSFTVGDIYNLSSYQMLGAGPTGTALPTVTAPGVLVVAAGSRYSYLGRPGNPGRVMEVDGHSWGVMTGTSMAAPTVAGIIAQWLQINPSLSPSDIKAVIAATAVKDSFTQNADNGYRFGPNGKIDAMAGARYLLHITDDEDDVLMGDVNNDSHVNISDVTALINYLLHKGGSEPQDETVLINKANADFNDDNEILITDLILFINYLTAID